MDFPQNITVTGSPDFHNNYIKPHHAITSWTMMILVCRPDSTLWDCHCGSACVNPICRSSATDFLWPDWMPQPKPSSNCLHWNYPPSHVKLSHDALLRPLPRSISAAYGVSAAHNNYIKPHHAIYHVVDDDDDFGLPTSFNTLRLSLCECVNPICRSSATVFCDRNATTQALLQLSALKFPPEPCKTLSWWTVASPRSISAACGVSAADSVAANVCDLSRSPWSGPWCRRSFSKCEPGTNWTHPFSILELSIASQKEAVRVSSVIGQYAKSWCLSRKQPIDKVPSPN